MTRRQSIIQNANAVAFIVAERTPNDTVFLDGILVQSGTGPTIEYFTNPKTGIVSLLPPVKTTN